MMPFAVDASGIFHGRRWYCFADIEKRLMMAAHYSIAVGSCDIMRGLLRSASSSTAGQVHVPLTGGSAAIDETIDVVKCLTIDLFAFFSAIIRC